MRGGEQARDALAAGAAMLLSYAIGSATFDNGDHFIMNLIFYMAIGAIWGVPRGTLRCRFHFGSSLG